MGQTPNYGFPFPEDGDEPDGPGQMEALAAAVDTSLGAHANATTAVHGIADTSDLVTQGDLEGLATEADVTQVQSNLDAHTTSTTSVHGIVDTAALETQTGAQAKADEAQLNALAEVEAAYLKLEGGTVEGDLTVTGSLNANGLTDWLNVRTFGAVGDGTTDDAEAIQEALDAAPAGGVVYLPVGEYAISQPLVVPPAITMMMPHSNLMFVPDVTDPAARITLLDSFAGDAAILFLNQDDGAYADIPAEHRLINVMVDGSAKDDAPVHGIHAEGNIQNIVMHGVTLRRMSGSGINTGIGGDDRFPYSWRLYRVMSDNNAVHGFAFSVMTDITMFDCQAIGNGEDGFHLQNLANSQLSLCRAEWNGAHGYNFTGDWGEGTGAGGLVATGCSTDRNNYDGVHIESTGTPPIIFNGLMLRRDGRNNGNGGGGFSGLASIDAETPVAVSGLTVFPGVNDDGENTSSPEIGVKVQGDNAVVLDIAVLHAAATPADLSGGAPNTRIGPGVSAFTGPTNAPVPVAAPEWGWSGTASAHTSGPEVNALALHSGGQDFALATVQTDGQMFFGDGTAAPDTPGWYREQAGTLKSDSYVNMEAGGQSGGSFTSWTNQAKALVAGGTGGGLSVAEGGTPTSRMGVATLSNGTVTVPNTSVTANTRVFLSRATLGASPGFLSPFVTPGTGFEINSSSVTDSATVNWLLIEPA